MFNDEFGERDDRDEVDDEEKKLFDDVDDDEDVYVEPIDSAD